MKPAVWGLDFLLALLLFLSFYAETLIVHALFKFQIPLKMSNTAGLFFFLVASSRKNWQIETCRLMCCKKERLLRPQSAVGYNITFGCTDHPSLLNLFCWSLQIYLHMAVVHSWLAPRALLSGLHSCLTESFHLSCMA